MKKSKIWLIVSILCIIAGAAMLLCSGVRSGDDLGWFLQSAGAAEIQEEQSVEVTERFHSLRILSGSSDVKLLPSGNGDCRVVWGETEYSQCLVSVEDGTLTVTREELSHARRGLILYYKSLPLRVYLPAGSYEKLEILTTSGDVTAEGGFFFDAARVETASGDIRLPGFTAGELRLSSTSGEQRLEGCSVDGAAELSSGSGDIRLEDTGAGSLSVSGTSSEVRLANTVSAGSIRVETGSGDIRLRDVSAESFDLSSTSGDVKGSIRGSVDFIVDTGSGDIRTRGGVRGAGECRVRTGSGDVDLEADR